MITHRRLYMDRLSKQIAFIIFFCLNIFYIQAQGLLFKGNEYIIDERTSYNVFKENLPTFKDSLSIKFDLSTTYKSNTGYILRLKTQIPSLIFNLSFDSQSSYIVYKLNEEGKSTLLTIKIRKEEFREGSWHSVGLKFNLLDNTISLNIDSIEESKTFQLPKTLQPNIFFGRSEYFIDLPTFSIRDLKIQDRSQTYSFPFKEHEGNDVHSTSGEKLGYVDNPTWLINKGYYWQHRASFQTKNTAGFNFDSIANKIYYFDKDSIRSYDVANGEIERQTYSNKPPIHLILGYNFLDAKNGNLYAYEVTPKLDKESSLARYNIKENNWAPINDYAFPKRLHHHGKFYDEINNRFIIFGGFGDMYYNNEFNCYSFDKNTWSTLKFTGDTIFPRYFLSMGYDKSKNVLYIFGGMGNESGEYNVGRKYYYDLYKVDLTAMHITKLWEIPWHKDHIVPVKSMIVLDDHFMTLCYPEHFSNTHLKLYKFSLENGDYKILGDSIPIRSEKITTNADLFFSGEMDEIYGIVQEFEDDDIASSLNIYSLSVPVLSYNELISANKVTNDRNNLFWIIIAISTTSSVILYWGNKKKDKKEKDTPLHPIYTTNLEQHPQKNAIFLFGNFAVYDRLGKNISYMFSSRLKQAFLLILENSTNEGITTQQLTQALWADRDDSKAKNIRGVTINELRKILEELDGISLIYENSFYRIIFDGDSFCDYNECMSFSNSKIEDHDISLFAHIAARGSFLQDDNDDLYDSLRTSLELHIEPFLHKLIQYNYRDKNFLKTISLCEAMLNIDSISDFAILYLIHAMEQINAASESRKRFFQFIVEYKKMIGEEYPKDYTSLLNENI